jgi:hypothetical protein
MTSHWSFPNCHCRHMASRQTTEMLNPSVLRKELSQPINSNSRHITLFMFLQAVQHLIMQVQGGEICKEKENTKARLLIKRSGQNKPETITDQQSLSINVRPITRPAYAERLPAFRPSMVLSAPHWPPGGRWTPRWPIQETRVMGSHGGLTWPINGRIRLGPSGTVVVFPCTACFAVRVSSSSSSSDSPTTGISAPNKPTARGCFP